MFLLRWFRRRLVVPSSRRFRPCVEPLEARTLLTSYTVTTVHDLLGDGTAGEVTLRDVVTAIDTQAASGNAPAGTPGLNTIDFAIGTAGSVQTINLAAPLPAFTQPAFLDGWSQGHGKYAGPPLIVLNGASAGSGADGLAFDAGSDGSTVRGLVIQQFSANGIALHAASRLTISANYIGTDVTGTAALGNGADAILIDDGATNNTIGGTGHDAGNVICGTVTGPPGGVAGTQASTLSLAPAAISGSIASFDVTMNYTDVPTDEMVYVGLDLRNSDSTLAPLDGAGQPDYSAFDFIPASAIGTGWAPVANAFPGEFLFHTPPSSGGTPNGLAPNASYFIGTVTYNLAQFGILPSANLSIAIDGIDTIIGAEQPDDPATFNFVNPSFDPGVQPLVSSPATTTTVGVEIAGSGTSGNRVIGNDIGTGPSGATAVGQLTDGILVDAGATHNTLGGPAAADANVIAGADDGIVVTGAGTDGNSVLGNRIGTDRRGTADLANTVAGVVLENGASGNTVGGTTRASANLIAFNGQGVVVGNSATDTTTVHDTILGNRLYGNVIAPIELGSQGPTPNGLNPRAFPNDGQNTPVLTALAEHAIGGALTSVPSTQFRIEFYATTVGSATPAEQLLGFQKVTTDATGNVSFRFPLRSLPLGEAITATATNLANGDTSEFSPIGVQIVILGKPVVASNHSGPTVPVSVEVLTANGPATTGQVQITVPGLPGSITVPLTGKPVITLAFPVPPGAPAGQHLIVATVLDEDNEPEATATGTLTIAGGVSRRWKR